MPSKYAVRALAAALLLFSAAQLRAQTDPANGPSILTGEQLAATGRPAVHAARLAVIDPDGPDARPISPPPIVYQDHQEVAVRLGNTFLM